MENTLKTSAKDLLFPELPYAYDALEPYIDKMTMEIHHSKHHKAYFDNFMKALSGNDFETTPLIDIFSKMESFPLALRNNGGGYFNHKLFWENMISGGIRPSASFLKLLEDQWESFDKFKEEFTAAAMGRFGSGWAWLNRGADNKLFITSTPNQDNPLMSVADKKGWPLLGLDVWEHAYYLKYQNRRPEYVQNFWNVVNWSVVEERFQTSGLR